LKTQQSISVRAFWPRCWSIAVASLSLLALAPGAEARITSITGDTCDLTGGYVPFAVTKAERVADGDPRLSLQERYGNIAGYTAAVTAAVNSLINQRLMLASDANGAIGNAVAWFTQAAGGALP
jgi:hypothetical protein